MTITVTAAMLALGGALGKASGSLRSGHSPSDWQGWRRIERAAAESLRSGSEESPVLRYEREPRSLLQSHNPQCTMPLEDPCTINTTAIGMVEAGYATYYDDTCEAQGFDGCFTQDIPECRTCYLSVEIYMNATNATEGNRPGWGDCPCCVSTTLANNHLNEEVQKFNFSIFGVDDNSCTDSPTQAPGVTPTPSNLLTPEPTMLSETPAPSEALSETPAPSIETPSPQLMSPAPSIETPSPQLMSPAPTPSTTTSGRGDAETPAPSSTSTAPGTPEPTASSSPRGAGTENIEETAGDGGDGLDTGAKIGIGVGVAVGVVVIGLASFGVLKASGRI